MKRVLLALIVIAFLSPCLYGQTIEKGDSELQFQGYYLTTEGLSYATGTMIYGHYLTSNIEIGVGPSISHSDSDYGDSETTFSGLAFFRYVFPSQSKSIPYINMQWYQYDFSPEGEADFTDYSWVQGGVGVKIFLNEYVAYDLSGNYGMGLAEGSEGMILLAAGVSVFF